MTSAEDASLAGIAASTAPAAAPARRRGRLVRKYALLFIALVGVALVANSALDFWFSYQENKAALVRVQQEKADAAAQRIEEFIGEIERQIGWTTHAQWAAGPLDQRRFDYVRLQRQVPAITELSQLDADGKEQLKVSRLAMDVVGSGQDFSSAPAFTEAKAHGKWFSPVYFRKESEPYMTLAIARSGKNAGVTVAEINLKLIYNVITALEIGQGGYAYVVDQHGRLIAHPDISLVLRDTDLSKLPQVAAALAAPQGAQAAAGRVAVARNISDRSVLTAHAAIAPLGWLIFVEVPLSEAFAPLYGAAWRTGLVLLFGLVAAALAALVLARRMTGPIRAIQAGAARIGAGELDRRIEIHTGDELEDLADQFNGMAAGLQKSYAELENKVEERTAELSEALDQQTATAEVLQVINSSPGDLAPVFDAMLDKAMRLGEAAFGVFWAYDGEAFRAVAQRGVPKLYAEYLRGASFRVVPGSAGGLPRLLEGADLVQFADVGAAEDFQRSPGLRALVELGRARSSLAVALRKDGRFLGALTIYRQEVRPFTDKQVALSQNFAAQAVIAMENARLITETQEALDQQTATAEVLGVINSSPGDLAPVFQAMLEKAVRLCEADSGHLALPDGDDYRTAAAFSMSPEMEAVIRAQSYAPGRGTAVGRALQERRAVQIDDIAADPEHAVRHAADKGLIRTILGVPLLREGVPIGAFGLSRARVEPFTERQIELVRTFADQAVIAMENARLITETREALDQQTATAEVLGVINSSPGDLAPVFDVILEKSLELCDAVNGHLYAYDGELLHPLAAQGEPRFVEWMRHRLPFRPAAVTPLGRLFDGEPIVHFANALTDGAFTAPELRELVDIGNIRTTLIVGLRKDEVLLGSITVFRQEVRPFTDKQIALLQNFAAQAVIAMENARLITETQEALDQQTATAEVLQVINSSPGNLAPVFDAMLERARGLCGAAFGTFMLRDGERFSAAAVHGAVPPAFAAIVTAGFVPSPASPIGRLRAGEHYVHISDLAAVVPAIADDPVPRAAVELGGIRTLLMVPLVKDGNLLGVFTNFRQEVRPFTDKQIALLQNFAAQAVIAMENARLITETQEALDQQTATAEVLGVINSSPGDLAPVFDAMLERALSLCGGAFGILHVFDGESFHPAATRGVPAPYVEFLQQNPPAFGPGTGPGRIRAGEAVVHNLDLKAEELYSAGDPNRRSIVDLGGARSHLAVALRRDDALLGTLTIYRQEVRAFSDKEISLLQNFAAQAVIAMENARLLTETQEALDQQTATAEVLGVINSSPGDLAPVFNAMLEKAARLCEATFGLLGTYDRDGFHGVAAVGFPMESAQALSRIGHPPSATALGRLERTKQTVQLADIALEPAYAEVFPRNPWLRHVHTNLVVPMLKEGDLIGVFNLFREEVRPFTDKQIALLQNFAAQAVIAMENARLLDQIRQRQAELRVTFDNMADGVAMFDAELRLAAWNKNFQELIDLPDDFLAEPHDFEEYIRYLTERGEFGAGANPETEIARLRARYHEHYSFERTRPDGRVIEIRHNPMPEGGFVLIYSDITERKRSEAEIRASRDAAQAALRDLKSAQANLVQAEKMASLGQLTAGIAHEIKNPLNFVNNFASLSVELLDELKETAEPGLATLDDDKRADVEDVMGMLTGNLQKITEHGRRADNIVKSMLEHSRGASGERRAVDLNGLVEEALNLAYHGARAQDQSFNITMERDFAEGIAPVELAPQDVTRVFLNLFGNGFYAANKRFKAGMDPQFKPVLRVVTRDLGAGVEVRVRDNGTGIPPEIRDKLFQPFFTTKPTGEGTGLGLSISYDIVAQQHGGTIEVDSKPGEFTEFTIRLPRNGHAAAGAP